MAKLLLFLFICCTAVLPAQSVVPGEILIQLQPGFSIDAVITRTIPALPAPVVDVETLSEEWHIYRWQVDTTADIDVLCKMIRKMPGIAIAQPNHYVTLRSKSPDDPQWFMQKNMGLINMSKAWDYTTGGLTPHGDTIVVAVFESGIFKSHPDLTPNFYRNYGEIPDNGIDEDDNGYVDDYLGWDAGSGAGDGDGAANDRSHGTSVCGIIGAQGDNDLDVTGVNWEVQMIPFVNVRTEAQIVRANNYVAKLRRAYNTSNGAEGALVVATNNSFGVDFAKPNDPNFDMWCPLFDSLGVLGILSIASTSNKDINVDTEGDMPTNCTSPYLIAVTELSTETGERAPAGYGNTSVDIAAPGASSFTTVLPFTSGNTTVFTANFDGTSASCPHVTGAVALLYSLPCDSLVLDATSKPAVCAARIRDAIFRNAVPEPSFSGLTTTEGRLDVFATAKDIMDHCAGTAGKLAMGSIFPNPVSTTLEIRYQTPDYGDYRWEVYNMLGQLVYFEDFSPPGFQAKIKYMDVTKWARGMHIVVLRQGDVKVVKKIIKM